MQIPVEIVLSAAYSQLDLDMDFNVLEASGQDLVTRRSTNWHATMPALRVHRTLPQNRNTNT